MGCCPAACISASESRWRNGACGALADVKGRGTSKGSPADGQVRWEDGLHSPPGPLTSTLVISGKVTPYEDLANCLMDWLLPGSWAPNWLQGKPRIVKFCGNRVQGGCGGWGVWWAGWVGQVAVQKGQS